MTGPLFGNRREELTVLRAEKPGVPIDGPARGANGAPQSGPGRAACHPCRIGSGLNFRSLDA
jgi:hypothetical protein